MSKKKVFINIDDLIEESELYHKLYKTKSKTPKITFKKGGDIIDSNKYKEFNDSLKKSKGTSISEKIDDLVNKLSTTVKSKKEEIIKSKSYKKPSLSKKEINNLEKIIVQLELKDKSKNEMKNIIKDTYKKVSEEKSKKEFSLKTENIINKLELKPIPLEEHITKIYSINEAKIKRLLRMEKKELVKEFKKENIEIINGFYKACYDILEDYNHMKYKDSYKKDILDKLLYVRLMILQDFVKKNIENSLSYDNIDELNNINENIRKMVLDYINTIEELIKLPLFKKDDYLSKQLLEITNIYKKQVFEFVNKMLIKML